MHIKKVTINGFRSYLNQTFDEVEWSPKLNVVVGKNGSGKSNFFSAIQFVLVPDKFGGLRGDERTQLLHQGAKKTWVVVVEIVFDNSDGRLVIPGAKDEAEVKIRRTFGLKQDEFRVNERRFTAAEVRQLLEGAGFSSSNPYYIVEQGKITTLAHMSGEERYLMLKDIAGTKVYEARRAESTKILEETTEKNAKIDASITQLDDRLAQLEGETAELREYQKADTDRRLIEYAVYHVELSQAKATLESLDSAAGGRLDKAQLEAKELDVKQRAVEDATAVASRNKSELRDLEQLRATADRELTEASATLRKLELQRDDLGETDKRAVAEQQALQKEEGELGKALAEAAKKFSSKSSEADRAKAELATLATALEADDLRLEALQARRGRQAQFSSAEARNKWLDNEIARNDTLLKDVKKQADAAAKQRSALSEAIATEQRRVADCKQAISAADKTAKKDTSARDALLAKRDKLGGERRQMWAVVHDREGQVRRANEAVDRARHRYEKAVRHDIRQGLQSLEETLNELKDPRLRAAVHGPVVQLMKVADDAQTAIDVTAGNTLFNVVVDSFAVSDKLLSHINAKRKPGRVTFFPLDTCKTRARQFPDSPEYASLLSKVSFDQKFESIFAELFGKTLLIKDLSRGPATVSEFDCDCITYDGDQFSRRGAITGGFLDVRSKLRADADLRGAQKAYNEARKALESESEKVAQLDQAIATVLRDLDAAGSQDEAGRATADATLHELRVAEERLSRATQGLEQNDAASERAAKSLRSIKAHLDALAAEKKAEFKSTLSAADEAELLRLQGSVTAQRAKADECQTKVTSLATERQMLSDTISHLERRQRQVIDRLTALQRQAPEAKAVEHHALPAAKAEVAALKARLTELEKSVDKHLEDQRKYEEQAAAARQSLAKLERDQQDRKDTVERAHNQRALALQQKEAAHAKMRKLGAVSVDAASKYITLPMAKLLASLKAVNETLKKYGSVNRKALEQYTQLHENREALKADRRALQKELHSVETLLTHLDQQKGEAVTRTFKQVQKHFEDVFAKLVGAEGCGAQLSLVENTPAAIQVGNDAYSAVKIDVCFSAGSPTTELSQLSGGQKSLVALSLIFAIQHCDPAPFYLFDEVDAALDAEYRTNVARMIQAQSRTCQFMTATFKTELLDVADRAFGIEFRNKVSTIHSISVAEARALLKQAAREQSAAVAAGEKRTSRPAGAAGDEDALERDSMPPPPRSSKSRR